MNKSKSSWADDDPEPESAPPIILTRSGSGWSWTAPGFAPIVVAIDNAKESTICKP